ncbi:MAG: hypothetical protein QOF48_2060 [Verrucomicrobiota bacterium]
MGRPPPGGRTHRIAIRKTPRPSGAHDEKEHADAGPFGEVVGYQNVGLTPSRSFLPGAIPAMLPALKAKQSNETATFRTARPGRGPRRKWLFRCIAITLPFAALLVVEMLLRLFGYGNSPHFFLKGRFDGREVYLENPDFARRFFPPGLVRSPQPVILPAIKQPGTFRVFVLGESAAMGDPEPAFGFPRVLEVLLRDAMPAKKIEVINVAVTAINSHVIRGIARDCADKQGDWWIVYMGNNEVVGPFGAGTVFGRQTPSTAILRASLAAKSTRLGQFLDGLKWKFVSGRPRSWDGMEMFLQQQVALEDPRMARVYQNFERNLEEIIRLGRESGAEVLISTVASNLKDCPPFASASLDAQTNGPVAEWKQRVTAGTQTTDEGRFEEALKILDGTPRYFSNSAAVFFQVARCQKALGRGIEARANFERARDLDTLRFRADTRINGIIRHTAARNASSRFLDAVELMDRHSTNGIAGEEFFYEHVHFNFAGNYLLGRTFAAQILGVTNVASMLSSDECARRLAYTVADRARVLDEMLRRVQQPPFTAQIGAAAREARWRQQAIELHALLRPDTFDSTSAIYTGAIAREPGDWTLRENFARFLQEAGDFKAAEEQWRQLIGLMPRQERAYYGLAYALDARGRSAEAIQYFREALNRRPRSVEARNGLGLALASHGDPKAAVGEFETALREKPDFAEARVNLGQTLAQQGRLDDAREQYAEALRGNSNNGAAHINLGKLLAGQGKNVEAAAQYREALRVKPDNAVAHFNLGNALTAMGDPEAASHFEAATKSNPNFAEAHYNLALELARREQFAAALAHFSEAARLKPDFADGRFNLGVALAKAGRFAEAISEFQETLRLDPANQRAQKFIEEAHFRLQK